MLPLSVILPIVTLAPSKNRYEGSSHAFFLAKNDLISTTSAGPTDYIQPVGPALVYIEKESLSLFSQQMLRHICHDNSRSEKQSCRSICWENRLSDSFSIYT